MLGILRLDAQPILGTKSQNISASVTDFEYSSYWSLKRPPAIQNHWNAPLRVKIVTTILIHSTL